MCVCGGGGTYTHIHTHVCVLILLFYLYRSESLKLCAATCLGVITETLPKFLSSFISDIITKVKPLYTDLITCMAAVGHIPMLLSFKLCRSKMVPTEEEQQSQLLDKLSQVRYI